MHTPGLLGWVKRSDIEIVQISFLISLAIPKMVFGVGEMGFIFCGKQPLLVTRTQVTNPGAMGPLVLKTSTTHMDKHVIGDTVFHDSSSFYISCFLLFSSFF